MILVALTGVSLGTWIWVGERTAAFHAVYVRHFWVSGYNHRTGKTASDPKSLYHQRMAAKYWEASQFDFCRYFGFR
jgi:hypothetical protein